MAECFFSLEHIFIIKKVHIKWDVVISSFFIVDIINERDHTFMTSKQKEKGINFALHPPPPPPPPPPPSPFFCLSEWVQIGRAPPTPGRRNLGYQPPLSTTTNPILFGTLAKCCLKPNFLQNQTPVCPEHL